MKRRQPFTVVIGKKHCDGDGGYCYNYVDPEDCPLYRATKEQYPDFPLLYVGSSGMLRTAEDKDDFDKWEYNFGWDPDSNGWDSLIAVKIAGGELDSFTVTISPIKRQSKAGK
jgi:hypothetical protein